MIKEYDLKKSPLYRLQNKRKLANLLNVELKLLTKDLSYEYSVFYEPKADGSQREINNPNFELKKIQRRLLILLNRIEKPHWLYSCSKGKGYVENAKSHIGKLYSVTADIHKFYENVQKEKIYYFFFDTLKMSTDISDILTRLVTNDGKLPTGAPTSQIISFLAYRDMFDKIYEISQRYNCKNFTLYVDDLTFSSETQISSFMIYEIDTVLKHLGLRLKAKKTKYYSKNQSKTITGGIINASGELKVPNKLRNSIMILLKEYKAEKDIFKKEKIKNRLIGKINSARQIEKNIFIRLLEDLKAQ